MLQDNLPIMSHITDKLMDEQTKQLFNPAYVHTARGNYHCNCEGITPV